MRDRASRSCVESSLRIDLNRAVGTGIESATGRPIGSRNPVPTAERPAQQALQLVVRQRAQDRLAVRRAVKRESLANRRYRPQAMPPLDLVGKDRRVPLEHGEVDCLAGDLRQLCKDRARDVIELHARRRRQPDECGAEADPGGRRCGDHELLRPQRSDDALDRRACETNPLGDLAEAETFGFTLKGAQDVRRAREDLDALLGTVAGCCGGAGIRLLGHLAKLRIEWHESITRQS